jgi:hypothetical protein
MQVLFQLKVSLQNAIPVLLKINPDKNAADT